MANEEEHALVADGETHIEFALMANNENKVFDNSLCSKECRKNTESLTNKIDELKNDLYEANIYRHSYKLRVDQLERRLAEYKEREVKYIETIRSLERDKEYNLKKINKLTSEVETLQEEKDVLDGKLARLLKSSIIKNYFYTVSKLFRIINNWFNILIYLLLLGNVRFKMLCCSFGIAFSCFFSTPLLCL
uniref:Uncharacterized protein n=1 Tax=Tanacetum cinerariifolium TaxID=118510 RepID=A0A6L2LGP6_TANCI|nr:hypothetical protein [Tanacetum cinerariifolium]